MVEDEQARQSYTYCASLLHCFGFHQTSRHIHTLYRNLTILDIWCRLCNQEIAAQGTLLKLHRAKLGNAAVVCYSWVSWCPPQTKRMTPKWAIVAKRNSVVPGRNPEQDQSHIRDPPANGQPGNGGEGQDGYIMHQTTHYLLLSFLRCTALF